MVSKTSKHAIAMGSLCGKKSEAHKLMTPMMFIWPSLAFIVVFSFYPFIKTIVATVTIDTEQGLKWVGMQLWEMIFEGEHLKDVLANTFHFALLNLVFTFAGALFLALFTDEQGKGQRLVETLFSLPMAIASAPAAAVWSFILRQDGGILNSFLGTQIGWLVDSRFALLSVAIVTSWTHVASSYILLLAGLRNVPKEIVESAKIDGAGPLKIAFNIKIPVASPQIFYVLFLNIITAFRTFTQIKLLTGAGPAGSTATLMYDIYEQNNFMYGLACCESLILFVIMFIASRLSFMVEKKFVHYD